MTEHKPYVAHDAGIKDFSIRAIIVGAIFGAVFGSANAYLGLRVGLTISTSIPLAIISVAVFRALKPIWGSSTILEHNLSQTTGSASSSLASGIIFTIPALFLWGLSPSIAKIGMLAMLGGVLGVLFMIPLRRFLIVREHKILPYPEGTASAEVLMAADAGGARAKKVFEGLGIGAAYKALLSFLHLWPDLVSIKVPLIKKAVVGIEPTPALIGVGYILGYRIAAIMVAGGLLSWLVLIPLIAHFGDLITVPMFPETAKLLKDMTPSEIWSRYIRYIGAGAVAFAGLVTVCKSLKMMYESLKIGIKELFSGEEFHAGKQRTDRDLPIWVIIVGIVIVIAVIAAVPHLLGASIDSFPVRLVSAASIAVFAFIFVTVSSRIVGLVGVTSNPTSGMIIVTLLGTSLVFFLIGWTDTAGMATALTVGTVVGIAASIAGDISQDLKTGYIIGATPARQQISEVIGAVVSAFCIAYAVWMLGETLQFGSRELPAPQATLMKTVVEGVLQANLPWGLVLTGAAIAAVAELLSVPSLPFAVGIYLPLSTMTPVFVGGLIRRLAEHFTKDAGSKQSGGILLGSGLIAGEGLVGVGLAVFAYFAGRKPEGLGIVWPPFVGDMISLTVFALLGLYLFRTARRVDS